MTRRRDKREPLQVKVGDIIYRAIIGYSKGDDLGLDIDHVKSSRGRLTFRVTRASKVPRALYSQLKDPLVSQSMTSRGMVAICATTTIPAGTLAFEVTRVRETTLEVKPHKVTGVYLEEYLGGRDDITITQNKVFNGIDIPKSLLKSVGGHYDSKR